MNERQMEIIISRGLESVLGEGHRLLAQQIGLDSGRLDLLVSRPDGSLMVVELKKGRLTNSHVDQVRNYSDTLCTDIGKYVAAMVIAQEAHPRTTDLAKRSGVRFKAISEEQLHELARQIGLSESDLLGDRRENGVLFGGGNGTGLRTSVPLDQALAECPDPIRRLVESLEATVKHARFNAGTTQIVLHYRGIKVGGLNRRDRRGCSYVATGVVLSPQHENILARNRFMRMTRNTTGKHEHVWWDLSWSVSEYARLTENAYRYFFKLIDDALCTGQES